MKWIYYTRGKHKRNKMHNGTKAYETNSHLPNTIFLNHITLHSTIELSKFNITKNNPI